MRLRILTLSTILILAISMTVFAQTDATPSNAEVFLTATQIIYEATASAQAQGVSTALSVTDDPFQLTATGLIVAATQTGLANGSSPVPVTEMGGSFELTATQLIIEATGTAQSSSSTEAPSDEAVNGADSPMSVTMFAFAGLILVLVIIGGVYLYLNSRAGEKRK